jgi:hypothetical protein
VLRADVRRDAGDAVAGAGFAVGLLVPAAERGLDLAGADAGPAGAVQGREGGAADVAGQVSGGPGDVGGSDQEVLGGLVLAFRRDVAVFDWGNPAGPDDQAAVRRSHVLSWFPGEILTVEADPDADAWTCRPGRTGSKASRPTGARAFPRPESSFRRTCCAST